jgi:hypothetical protein
VREEAAGNVTVTSTLQTATLGANPSNKSSTCDQESANHADRKKTECAASTSSETVSHGVGVQNPDRSSGTSGRGPTKNTESPDHQSGQTFRSAGYNAKRCLEPAVVQLVKYRIDEISDKIRTPVQLQQAFIAAAADSAKDIKIQNVLPLHEDTKFCLKCPTETAAYSATDVNSLGHLPTNVQTGILDTGASGHIVKSPAQMATSRATDEQLTLLLRWVSETVVHSRELCPPLRKLDFWLRADPCGDDVDGGCEHNFGRLSAPRLLRVFKIAVSAHSPASRRP